MTTMAHSRHSIDADRTDFKGKQTWIKLIDAELLQKMYEYVKNANNLFRSQPPTLPEAIFKLKILFLENEHTSPSRITTGNPSPLPPSHTLGM